MSACRARKYSRRFRHSARGHPRKSRPWSLSCYRPARPTSRARSSQSTAVFPDNIMSRTIAWRAGEAVGLDAFSRDVDAVRRSLPAAAAMIALCEDRYHFLLAFSAALLTRQTVLL